MQTAVTFKNMDTSPHYREYVESKLERLEKLLDDPGVADVTLSVEKLRHIAEINLSSHKLAIHASEESEGMHAAIDLLMDKVRKQINKKKEKLRGKRDKTVNEML